MAIDVNRIQAGEDLTTEFKREYTEDIKKTVVAFANTSGGILYIGVNDDKSIVGVDNPDDVLLQITSAVRTSIKPDVTLFVDYKTEKVKNAAIITVTVQKGTACPYYLAGKGIRPEGVYVRQGPSTVSATETAILNMIKETDGEKYEEIRALNQDLTFTQAGRFFKSKELPFAQNQQKTLHLQTADGMYTNLGLILSDQSIHTVKLAVFQGLEKEIFKDRKEFSGSLLKQLEEIYAYLDMYNHTHAKVNGLYREDQLDYPEDVLREALLNALVHRDYAFSSSILISLFDDRIEFVSIGGLPKGVSLDDIQLGLSVPRNENLANVFYRLRLIEAYGTGIPRIMRSYKNCSKKPILQATNNAFKITLPNRNVIGHETTGLILAQPSAHYFAGNEETIIGLFDKQAEITRNDVEHALALSQAQAVRILRGLVDKNVIRVINGGNKTRYVKI